MKGTFKARAREWGLGISDTGKEQVAVLFDYLDEHGETSSITWFGYFTEGTIDRTLDSLRYMGWASDSLAELDALGANEVELVLDEETYQGKTRTKVKWVNRPSRLALKTAMDANAVAAFAARMRGKTVANKQKHASGMRPAPASAPRSPASDGPPPDDWQPEDEDNLPF